jgi:DNA-binding transcriptional regulator GbsR (MarR family)
VPIGDLSPRERSVTRGSFLSSLIFSYLLLSFSSLEEKREKKAGKMFSFEMFSRIPRFGYLEREHLSKCVSVETKKETDSKKKHKIIYLLVAFLLTQREPCTVETMAQQCQIHQSRIYKPLSLLHGLKLVETVAHPDSYRVIFLERDPFLWSSQEKKRDTSGSKEEEEEEEEDKKILTGLVKDYNIREKRKKLQNSTKEKTGGQLRNREKRRNDPDYKVMLNGIHAANSRLVEKLTKFHDAFDKSFVLFSAMKDKTLAENASIVALSIQKESQDNIKECFMDLMDLTKEQCGVERCIPSKCVICLDHIGAQGPPTALVCGHVFCADCLKHVGTKHKKTKCPLCKQHSRTIELYF